MLKGLGVKVERFAVPRTLEEVPGPVSQMGRALGREAAAAAIVAAYRARLAALPAPPGGARPIAAFFHPGGYTLGAGTMADAILARAGFDNLADRLGRSGGGYLSLEELVMHRPDVIVTSPSYAGASRAEAVMTHPALAGIPRVVAGPEWTCGTPYVLDAVAAMIAAREALK